MSTYRQSPEADATMAGDRAAIFHRGTRVAITLNATGTLLWSYLSEPRSESELVDHLSQRFPALAADQATRDVQNFLGQLSSHGLIQPL